MANGGHAAESSPYVELERAAWAALAGETDDPLTEAEIEAVSSKIIAQVTRATGATLRG